MIPGGEVDGSSALEVCPSVARYNTHQPSSGYRFLERLIDIGAVMVAAPIVVVIVAVAALAIKIESPGGSVLHRRSRTGLGTSRFTLFELRTMVPNADEMKAELRHLNERTWPDFKISNDPRVLRCGHFLRATGLWQVSARHDPSSSATSTSSCWRGRSSHPARPRALAAAGADRVATEFTTEHNGARLAELLDLDADNPQLLRS